MGVRRLSALLETHRDIYHDALFGNNRLVIDGCDVIERLYFDSGLDQNHGGEYAAFEELIENFISALRSCSVSPYVVLQVSKDAIGKKPALTSKVERRIWQAHRAAVEGSQENILPLLASLVFKQTLVQLKVPMVVCYEEANQEIAALASEWDCPVLSSDSDFYIFDIPAGMLPLSHFHWRTLKERDSQRFIPCKTFNTSNFCSLFEIQKQLLPMFGALAKQKWSVSWSKFAQDGEEKWSRLQGLLSWMKRFQLHEEAVEATLELVPGMVKEKKQKMRDSLYEGMQEYWLPNSRLNNFFTDGTLPSFPEAAGLIPSWIHPLLVEGKMTTDILEVLRLKRRVLRICVGSTDLPSPYLTSRPLRRVMYGLLLPEWDSSFPVEVAETDRVGLKLEEILFPPDFKITNASLLLDSMHKVEHSHRLRVLLKALGVQEAALSRLRPELRLPVAVTCYWWQNARPSPGDRLLRALLLGLSVGASQSQEEVAEMKGNAIDSSDSSNVAVIHSVTQWQICLKDSVQLNQLLCLPFDEPQISRLYEGALVNRLVQLMTPGKAKNLLKQNVPIVEEYENMLAIVCQSDGQQPRRGREAQGKHVQEAADSDQLFEPDEKAADNSSLSDTDLEQTFSLRMRFTKDKRQRTWNKNLSSSNPMVLFKQDRRWGLNL